MAGRPARSVCEKWMFPSPHGSWEIWLPLLPGTNKMQVKCQGTGTLYWKYSMKNTGATHRPCKFSFKYINGIQVAGWANLGLVNNLLVAQDLSEPEFSNSVFCNNVVAKKGWILDGQNRFLDPFMVGSRAKQVPFFSGSLLLPGAGLTFRGSLESWILISSLKSEFSLVCLGLFFLSFKNNGLSTLPVIRQYVFHSEMC